MWVGMLSSGLGGTAGSRRLMRRHTTALIVVRPDLSQILPSDGDTEPIPRSP